jgi:4-amino-4-deoxy-L-arabinose transferase-like glycosyltransferase
MLHHRFSGATVAGFPTDRRQAGSELLRSSTAGWLARAWPGGLTCAGLFWAVAVLIGLRAILALVLPLSFDEAYFWLWSKHLALSYYDHPPLIALAIRLGTLVAGDTEIGVRLVPLIASVAASWALWRAADLAFDDRKAAWTACLLFNATLMIAAESASATPDSLVLAAACFLLLAMAQLQRTGNGRWWLAVGLSVGLALFSKYTGLFLAASVGLWLVLSPAGRPWLRSSWPYAGAAITTLFLAPTIYWNAQHDWVSFRFQFGRVIEGRPSLVHLFEFCAGQLALASPPIAVLAVIGLLRQSRGFRENTPLAFAAFIAWPALVYFLAHALHDRVQGNWPSFIFPALILLAASVIVQQRGQDHGGSLVRTSIALTIPVVAAILLVSYAQAFLGLIPMGNSDPLARMTAIGFRPVAERIAATARKDDAGAIATSKYALTGWLAFYRTSPIPVVQLNEDYRWLSSPKLSRAMLNRPLLYVTQHPAHDLRLLSPHFAAIRSEGDVDRARNGRPIDRYYLFVLSGFHGAPVGRVPAE